MLILHPSELKQGVLLSCLPQFLSKVLLISRSPIIHPKNFELTPQNFDTRVQPSQKSDDIRCLSPQFPEIYVPAGKLSLGEDKAFALACGNRLFYCESILLIDLFQSFALLDLRVVPADLGTAAQSQKILPFGADVLGSFGKQSNGPHLHCCLRNRVGKWPREDPAGLFTESDDAKLGKRFHCLSAGLLDVIIDIASDAVAGGGLFHANVAKTVVYVVVDMAKR